jgi:predicted solute-binding protein
VFAVWVSNKLIDKQFIEKFNISNAFGINHIKEVIKLIGFLTFDLELYYSKHIKYIIDNKKQNGLNEFLTRIDKQSYS